MAGTAVANHQFPDVAPASPFHDAITAFGDAGCATGFPDGGFHPTEPVKRQQTARFVSACGGRVGFVSESMAPTESHQFVTAALTPGALPGGGGFVLAATDVQPRRRRPRASPARCW